MTVTIDDLADRVGITTPVDPESATGVNLARVLGAVRSKIAAGHKPPDEPTDDQVDAWDEATLLAAARLWKRRSTPEGVLGLGTEGVIRVGRFDADVADLLAEFVTFTIG